MSQPLAALRRANAARTGIARVKAEVAALGQADGARRAAMMLRDPDEAVGAMTIDALILSVHRMGAARMVRLFNEARFPVATRHRRVRDLTERQRHLLADILEDLADIAADVASRRTA